MVGHPPKRVAAPTARERRRTRLVALAVSLATVGALAGYVATSGHAFDASGRGCVTVTFAGATGGEQEHACGAQARAWCHTELVHGDALRALVLAQCRVAGILVAPHPGHPAASGATG